MGLISTVYEWLKKVPWYLQIYLGLVLIPNIIMNALLVYFIFLPWHYSSIQAQVTPLSDTINREVLHIVERQDMRDANTSESIKRIEQHQGLMYQALLNRQN